MSEKRENNDVKKGSEKGERVSFDTYDVVDHHHDPHFQRFKKNKEDHDKKHKVENDKKKSKQTNKGKISEEE